MKNTYKTNGSMDWSAAVQSIDPKTAAAVVLLSIMALLWGRVFFRGASSPESAGAAVSVETIETQNDTAPAAKTPAVRIVPVELPYIAGRHDRLVRDIFSFGDRRFFAGQEKPDKTAVHDGVGKQRQDLLARLTKAVNLDAVIQNTDGQPEKACINGQVVAVGSVVSVKLDAVKYELKVNAIENNRVRIAWDENIIELKMPESIESGL